MCFCDKSIRFVSGTNQNIQPQQIQQQQQQQQMQISNLTGPVRMLMNANASQRSSSTEVHGMSDSNHQNSVQNQQVYQNNGLNRLY